MSNTKITHPIPTTDLEPPNSPPSDPEKQTPQPSSPQPAFHALGLLDRFLPLWILLARATGILLDNFVPSISTALTTSHFASVSLPIATDLLTIVYPTLCAINYESLPHALPTRALYLQLALSIPQNLTPRPDPHARPLLPSSPGLRT